MANLIQNAISKIYSAYKDIDRDADQNRANFFQGIQQGIGNLGKTLQKVPNVNVLSKQAQAYPQEVQQAIKRTTPITTKAVTGLTNLFAEQLRSYGRGLESVSTEPGRQQLAQGFKQIPMCFGLYIH